MIIDRIILATIYAFSMAYGIYFYQRIPILLLLAIVSGTITILALIGRVGDWARIVALLFAGLFLLKAVGYVVSGIWQFYNGVPNMLLSIVYGLMYAALYGWTIWILRTPAIRADGGGV